MVELTEHPRGTVVAVRVLLPRLPRRFPASPLCERTLLIRLALMVPFIPAACHASITSWVLAWGLSTSSSFTNMPFPWLRVAVAGMESLRSQEVVMTATS